MDKDLIDSLKEKFNTIRSKKAMVEQVLAEKKKEREERAKELMENGIDVSEDMDLTREELENKTSELAQKLGRELDAWDQKIEEIKKDLFK